ncbi:MAG: ATP-binding protein, partial [Bacteroidota bacterium]
CLKIAIIDQGIGIAPEEQPYVFGQFQQLGQGPNPTKNGTGLGLYICKRLANLMGGTIGVISEKGRAVRFGLPLRPRLNPCAPLPTSRPRPFPVPMALPLLKCSLQRITKPWVLS